jgi:hypothetical protein
MLAELTYNGLLLQGYKREVYDQRTFILGSHSGG